METAAPRFIDVYTESNPNPGSLKFVATVDLLPPGDSLDFPNPASALNSPLVTELFKFNFVQRVFIASNFITITKSPDVEWFDVKMMLKDYIKAYLEEEKPIFRDFVPTSTDENDSQLVLKIKSLLDEYVRPAVEMDGGAISFHSFKEDTGTVTVNLQGSCSGCPSSTITLKNGIENLLKRMVPEVNEVIAEGV